MFHWIYERMLLSQIEVLPRHICFMISGADMAADPGKCVQVARWSSELNDLLARQGVTGTGQKPPAIQGLTFHITQLSPEELSRSLPAIKKISSVARLVLHHGTTEEVSGTGLEVVVAIGKSGREEITECIRQAGEERDRAIRDR